MLHQTVPSDLPPPYSLRNGNKCLQIPQVKLLSFTSELYFNMRQILCSKFYLILKLHFPDGMIL